MDYYIEKFKSEFPQADVDDYMVLLERHSFLKEFFLIEPCRRFLLFCYRGQPVGAVGISPWGRLQKPQLLRELRIQAAERRNCISIAGGSQYDGDYQPICSYQEKNRKRLLAKLISLCH